MNKESYDWMEESRQLAAQCWCDPETQNIDMYSDLCEAVAKRIALWMQTAAQNQCNTDYYRVLVEECGKAIGQEAYKADDDTLSEDVLCAKIPELVQKQTKEIARLKGIIKIERDASIRWAEAFSQIANIAGKKEAIK